MDTKAKVATGVGGIVLVGLLAFVLMPSSKTADEAANTADQTAPAADGATGDAFAATTAPSTQPVAAIDPFAAPPPTTMSTPTTFTPTVSVGPALPPVDTTDSWARQLDGPGRGGALDSASSNFSGSSSSSAGAIPDTYKVGKGDTLATISEKVYGTKKYASKIAAANPRVNASKLKVGQELKLPQINGASAGSSVASSSSSDDAFSSSASSSVGSASASASESSSSTPKTYKVQSGDSLRKIAAKLYGDAGQWEKLYAANRRTIGSDPSRLRAGMVLQVPKAR